MIEALSIADIEAALPRVREGLAPYLWLQSHRDTCDVRRDTEFRRRFNHFYRVRRGREWQDSFYALLERNKRHPASFETVLRALHRSTRQWEASFASKLVATVDPEMPVIDSAVLRNLGLRLPTRTSHSRAEQIIELHDQLAATLRHRVRRMLLP